MNSLAEALGMSLPHSALAPSGQQVWLDLARQSALAVQALVAAGRPLRSILTTKAIENAMVVHAAVGEGAGWVNVEGHVGEELGILLTGLWKAPLSRGLCRLLRERHLEI